MVSARLRLVVKRFDERHPIKIQDCYLTVRLLQFNPVEPQFFVGTVGKPRPGLLLPDAQNGAFDDAPYGRLAHRNLVRDADAHPRFDLKVLGLHEREYTRHRPHSTGYLAGCSELAFEAFSTSDD